jgi:Cys-rich four helix bundle protein (predicted Tat secretion target)
MTHCVDTVNALEAKPELSRRAALYAVLGTAAGAAALAGTSGQALAADDAGMDHSAMMGPPKHQAAIDKALVCMGRGEVCISHCLMMGAMGDTSLNACMTSVSSMLPLCASLAKLAALDSPRLKDLAKVCMDACADCEKECRKHEAKHAVCKACAEACADCIKECKAVIGA